MIAYRFLSEAEEEMSEAAVFYEAASVGLGRDILEDVRRVTHTIVSVQVIGSPALTVNLILKNPSDCAAEFTKKVSAARDE